MASVEEEVTAARTTLMAIKGAISFINKVLLALNVCSMLEHVACLFVLAKEEKKLAEAQVVADAAEAIRLLPRNLHTASCLLHGANCKQQGHSRH